MNDRKPGGVGTTADSVPLRDHATIAGRAVVRTQRVPPALRFSLLALCAAALMSLTYAAFVLTEGGQRLENLGLAGAALRSQGDVEDSLASLSQISVVTFGAAILLVFGLAVFRGRLGLAILAAAVMAVSAVLAEILKDVLPRPELVAGPAWLLRNTFPSGHATVAAAIAVGALIVAPGRLRWIVIPAGAVFVAIISQATQIAGWHRMSGTVGGILLVLAVASVALAVLAMRGAVLESSDGRIDKRIRSALVVAAGLALGLGVLVGILPVMFPLLVAPSGASGAFVHTSLGLLGVGISVLAFVAFAYVLEPYGLGRRAGARRPMATPTSRAS